MELEKLRSFSAWNGEKKEGRLHPRKKRGRKKEDEEKKKKGGVEPSDTCNYSVQPVCSVTAWQHVHVCHACACTWTARFLHARKLWSSNGHRHQALARLSCESSLSTQQGVSGPPGSSKVWTNNAKAVQSGPAPSLFFKFIILLFFRTWGLGAMW